MKITEGRVRVAASDVANFLACRRLMQLDLLMARKELEPPTAGNQAAHNRSGPAATQDHVLLAQ